MHAVLGVQKYSLASLGSFIPLQEPRDGGGDVNSLWTAFLFLPGSLLIFFKQGAWAWDGLLTFWVVAALFGGWFLVMTVVLRRSLRHGVG